MLYRLLTKQARRYGAKIAVAGEARSLTFRELLSEARAAAAAFQARGCKVGDSIILGLPPCPEFYVVFYAAAALGMIVLPVLPSGRIPELIAAKKPRWAVGEARFLEQARAHCASLRDTLLWERARGLIGLDGRARWSKKKIWKDECVIGVSSSGSTGTPTIYFRSQDLLVRRAAFRAAALGVTAEDVLLSARPFNSGSSINSHVIMPLVAGCKIVVQERIKRFEAADAIARERVTVLYTVPFVFELLASIPTDYPADFSSLRLCISGSAPLAQSVADAFARRVGVEIRQRYGGSHIHPAFTYNLAGAPGAVGQTFGSFPIAILDDDGEVQGPETIGEIAFDYRGIAPTWRKYLKDNPNRRGRYIYTGDLGRTDEQGNVYIVGRKSPFIKVRGNRVEPAEVEAALRAHPAVQEAFVFGINRGKPNEAVGALVVAAGVKDVDLIRHCAQRLDGYKCPRRVILRAALPRTAHGKIARSVLEEEMAGATLRP
jgi:long-chain acyl-CoA synthetase